MIPRICSIIIIAFSSLLFAQGWEKVSLNIDENLLSVFMTNNNEGLIVGSEGLILSTEDGWSSWETISSPVSENLNCVFFLDESAGWITGDNGIILHTTDGGQNWTKQMSGTSEQLTSVYFSAYKYGWVCGLNGTFLRTIDGGENWESVSVDNADDFYAINFNSLAPSPKIVDLNPNIERIYSCAVDDEENLYISTQDQFIYKVTVNGNISEYSSTSGPQGLAISPDNILYGAVSLGRVKQIVQFDNSGNSSLITNIPISPTDLDFDDNGTIWIVGYDNILSVDKQNNYKQYEISGQFNCLAMYSGYLYAGGLIDGKNAVWRFPVINQDSLGSGELYFDVSTAYSPSTYPITDIDIDSNGHLVIATTSPEGLLYILDSDNFTFKFSNDIPGITYSIVLTPDDRICAVYFQDSHSVFRQIVPNQQAQIGWIAGSQGLVLQTFNSGDNWSSLATNTEENLFDLVVRDSNTLSACGANGTIISSSDGGATWKVRNTNINTTIRSLSGSTHNLWAAGAAGIKMISENGGKSWFIQEKNNGEDMNRIFFCNDDIGFVIGDGGSLYKTNSSGYGQFGISGDKHYWMANGSLHNWFSSMGCEREVGRTSTSSQQDGGQWPAIGAFQDMQCSKGMWIGTRDFTSVDGTQYPHKVVHVGPRVVGSLEFFPLELKNYLRYNRPQVTVNGSASYDKPIVADSIDQNLIADQIITNTVNTEIGLTLTRRIMQFSLPGHDNYIIQEMELHNTGNTDTDPGIELPDQTLTDVYLFMLYRWAICFQTRYVIANGTGWGMNTMLNARGDGETNISFYNDPEEERFRAQYAWHGYFPQKIVSYDNIGGPIWSRDASGASTFIAEADTVGRLGASQFTGVVTLHADLSSSDDNDDINQPSTTGYYGSDEPNTSNNSSSNQTKMTGEYEWMTRGHMSPRHAWKVEPTGDFTIQTGSPNISPGEPGGFSAGNGYGPYTIGPGESIRIVLAEASAGISHEVALDSGIKYKRGELTDQEKNAIVLSGEDSLFQTFRRAIAAFNGGYDLPKAPPPPESFSVVADETQISLSWEISDVSGIQGFRLYRSAHLRENKTELIYEGKSDERTFIDNTAEPGVPYYYYIETISPPVNANPDLDLPAGVWTSGRYYTQTYNPAIIGPVDLISRSDNVISKYELYQNYPNPFNPETNIKFDLPKASRVELEIYNLLGQKVQTILNTWLPIGSHEVRFNASNWASGTYIYILKTQDYTKSKKLTLIK